MIPNIRQSPTTSRIRLYKIGWRTLPVGAAFLLAAFLLVLIGWVIPAPVHAQIPLPSSAADAIGQLSGDEMSVTGASDLVTANGRSTALLLSGSAITLRFGQAKIDLSGGGEIELCGPAHLTLLKSGGAITVALDYGRVHAEVDSVVPLTIYTPLIVATPVAIGQSRRDITIGLDQNDVMCALAETGAARIQQQFSGQAILLPQGGELNLTAGQLNGVQMGTQGCQCQLPAARDSVYAQLDLRAPVRPIAPPNKPSAATSTSSIAVPFDQFGESNSPNGTNNGFEMRVDMPPLTFGSSSPAPPPGADPQTLLLVREIRVQPGVVYQGVIAPAATSASVPRPSAAPPTAAPGAPSPAKSQTKSQKPGFWARLFGRHTDPSKCAGASCATPN